MGDILLEIKRRQAKKNDNKTLNAIALAYYNSDYQGQKAGKCHHCYKPDYIEHSC